MEIQDDVGIPFLGQNGFFPPWAKGAGRWVFQRTLVYNSGPLGFGELAALGVPVANQVIVWSPPKRNVTYWFGSKYLHNERTAAVDQLEQLQLRCYGKDCRALRKSGLAKSAVTEMGVHPERWYLVCPLCGGPVGPDLEPVSAEVIVARWEASGRPVLDNPAAGAEWRSAPAIVNLPRWIEKSHPSPLELAYLGQQLWPTLPDMFAALGAT
jgi:hypothetical protein